MASCIPGVLFSLDRFHQEVIDCLGRDRSVLQLTIGMTEYMQEIHGAIVQCMTTTLGGLKRSNTTVRLFTRFSDAVLRLMESLVGLGRSKC